MGQQFADIPTLSLTPFDYSGACYEVEIVNHFKGLKPAQKTRVEL
jgi:hypothetical protein